MSKLNVRWNAEGSINNIDKQTRKTELQTLRIMVYKSDVSVSTPMRKRRPVGVAMCDEKAQGSAELQISGAAGDYTVHLSINTRLGEEFLASSAPLRVLEAPQASAIELKVRATNGASDQPNVWRTPPSSPIEIEWSVRREHWLEYDGLAVIRETDTAAMPQILAYQQLSTPSGSATIGAPQMPDTTL